MLLTTINCQVITYTQTAIVIYATMLKHQIWLEPSLCYILPTFLSSKRKKAPKYTIIWTGKLSNILVSVCLEALPGASGNRGKENLFQGNKNQTFRGAGEQRQYLGTGNIRKQIFDFWGTSQFILGEKGNRYPREGLSLNICFWVPTTYV